MAVVAAAGGIGRAQANPPSENIHFALIGAGGQGRHVASRFLEVPGVKMTAVCEINPDCVSEAKKMSPEVKVYEDWNDLLSKETDLQAVVIGLPEDTHADATIAALEAKRDVFCEKPMAYSLDQSRAMIAARDKNNGILQIGQQRRSNPLYYLAERLVQKEGIVGNILRIDAFWDRWGDWKRPLPEMDKDFSPWGYPTLDHLINWRLYRKYGHGLITENGTHQLDASSWMLGGKKATWVSGVGVMRYNDGRETHDICTAEYLFEGDTIVRFSQDFHQGFNYAWSYGELLLGDEGSLRITAEQELVHYDKDRRATKIPIAKLGECEIAGVRSTPDELNAAEADRQGGGLRTYSYQHEFRIFANCVRNRTQPSCTGEIGHNAIAFTVTGSEAQYDGQAKTLTPEMFL